MQAVEIRSLDELIEYGNKVLRKELPYQPVTLVGDNFKFSTRVEGEGWSQKVDTRIARYVITLQDTMDEMLAEHSPAAYEEAPPRIRVELKEGSAIPWVEIKDFAVHLFTPMTNEQSFYLALSGLLATAGYFYLARILKYKADRHAENAKNEALSLHEQTKLAQLAAFETFAKTNQEKIQPYERPAKTLVNMLEPDDKIGFMHRDEEKDEEGYTREAARKGVPKRLPRTEEQTSYADGDYLLKTISFTEGEPVLYLSQGGIDIKAYTAGLSGDDTKDLIEDIALRQLEEELPMEIKVQLNVRHTARRIKHGSIVGTGEPRTDKKSKTLADILASFS